MDAKVVNLRIQQAILTSIEGNGCKLIPLDTSPIQKSTWKRLVYIGNGVYKACITTRVFNRLIGVPTAVLAVLRDQFLSKTVLQALAKHRCTGDICKISPSKKRRHRGFYAVVGLRHQSSALGVVMKWLDLILDPLIDVAWNEYSILFPEKSKSLKRKDHDELDLPQHMSKRKMMPDNPLPGSQQLIEGIFHRAVTKMKNTGLRGYELGKRIWFTCRDCEDYNDLTLLQRTRLRERLQAHLELESHPAATRPSHSAVSAHGNYSSELIDQEFSNLQGEVSSGSSSDESEDSSLAGNCASSTATRILPHLPELEHWSSDDSSDSEDSSESSCSSRAETARSRPGATIPSSNLKASTAQHTTEADPSEETDSSESEDSVSSNSSDCSESDTDESDDTDDES